MESPLRLLLLALLTAATKAKVFKGLDDYGGYRLCMAFYESTFNTAAQSIKANGSANYSVFQISSQLWCTDDHSPLDNGCRVACRGTTTLNITDDIIWASGTVPLAGLTCVSEGRGFPLPNSHTKTAQPH
uniref:Lysozyme n=1 Tax=Bubo bubo TaxID=30461 RepID=A0A8C0F2D6_BUBBB